MSGLVLLSPLAGWSTPLEEVPDPVFAGRMLGDGVAIDPLAPTVHAPCDGQVVALPESLHAVTLHTAQGVDVLMHIGIDTVGLAAEGFEAHVKLHQWVKAGDPLITFDLDLLARRAKSVLTPVLILEGSAWRIRARTEGVAVAVGDVLMELYPSVEGGEVSSAPEGRAAAGAGEGVSRQLRVALEHGIHARPAAQMVSALKAFRADVSVLAQGKQANARSTVALMKLGVRKGEQIEIRASGEDAAAAMHSLEAVLGMPDAQAHAPPAESRADSRLTDAQPIDAAAHTPLPGSMLRGVVASRGLAVGVAAVLKSHDIDVREAGSGVEHETAELERACTQVCAALQRTSESAVGAAREIVEAHLTLIEDPDLHARAAEFIAEGASAAFAWRRAIRESVEALRALDDPRMGERVDDLIDLERQVLRALSGERASSLSELAAGTIVIGEELLPSQLVGVDPAKLAGICLACGGATSHVSILAAAAGIPALVALGAAVTRIAAGTPLILDADAGQLQIDPGEARLESVRRRIAREEERRVLERQAAQHESRTRDGQHIEVMANLGSLADAQSATGNGADGCGLLRTEFLFLDRSLAPSEDEQRAEYQQIATALAGKPLTIRTLDAGGDKPIPYLPLPHEDNPALGLRGVRTSLWRPDLLRDQLRAVLAVRPYGQCRILLPMITDVAEIRSVRSLVTEASRRIGRSEPVELGVMIETPASALMAECLAAEVEFFSIGTNDLTQYTLAMDRTHPELAARLDALHPAVLRLIARTVEAAGAHGRRVAVCGGLASDPAAVPVLVGLGVHELSCVPSVIPRIKALIRELTLAQCTRVARDALAQDSAEAVRALSAGTGAKSATRASIGG